MSWTDEEIDSLFKEASLQNKVPAFQDAYFDELENLLPKKKRKALYFWYLSCSLVLISSTALFFQLRNTENNEGAKTIASRSFIGNTKKVNLSSKADLNQEASEFSKNVSKPTSTNFNQKNSQLENTVLFAPNVMQEKTQKQPSSSFQTSVISENPIIASKAINEVVEIESSETEQQTSLASEKLVVTDLTSESSNTETSLDQKREGLLDEQNNPQVILNLSTLAIRDELRAHNEQELLALNLPLRRTKHFISAEIGTGYSENFIRMEDASQKPMLNGSIALSYRLNFNKLFFSSGIAWSNYKPNELELNRQSKVYGFKTSYYAQSIDYKWINMIDVPLVIGRKFKRQSFSLGIAPSFVLGSQVNFTKTKNGEIIEKTSIYGNMLGLKKYALSVQIGYDMNIAHNLDLGIKVSNMLINPLDETRFTGSLNKLPFQANLTLKKHFRIK